MIPISLILCAIALFVGFKGTRRGVSTGVIATLAVGYAHGILRGNIQQPASHFIYDSAAIGMYLAMLIRPLAPIEKFRLRPLMPWFLCLIAWPILLFLVPTQDLMVQLVGLRASVFFLPFLLIGAMMNNRDFQRIAKAVAILNGAALAFALAEVYFGLQHFYSADNPVTLIVFHSQDIVYGGTAHYRIPATFVSSASYAGAMVASLPLLIGALVQKGNGTRCRGLLFAAIGLTALGVFLAASRSAVVPLLIIGIAATLPGTVRNVPRRAWAGLILAVAAVVVVTPRMQRFVTLQNTDYVMARIYGSINQNFITLATDYPLGNGLGGGGTSLPYFLQDRVTNPVVLENEYARIMAEQGIPGLALWLAFIIWLLQRPPGRRSDPWYRGKSLARLFCLISFATAPLGLGMLDAIPSTEMLLMLAGWFAAPELIRTAGPAEWNSLGQGSLHSVRVEAGLYVGCARLRFY
jgi:hypothetical protein